MAESCGLMLSGHPQFETPRSARDSQFWDNFAGPKCAYLWGQPFLAAAGFSAGSLNKLQLLGGGPCILGPPLNRVAADAPCGGANSPKAEA